ncbi:MAG: nitrilase family protein [bacterium]
MQEKIRAASVQFEHAPGDKVYNLSRIEAYVAQAAQEQTDLIAFPECCITGYWFLRELSRADFFALAEPVPQGASTQAVIRLAQQYRIIIGAGLLELDEEAQKVYNSYVVALPDGSWHCHRKLHAFVHPNLSSGSEYTVFDTHLGWKIGVLICYDNNLIENARITALLGADVLLAPHQTGGCDSRSPHAMGLVDPKLWEQRRENPEAIEAEFRGDRGRGWLMRWLPARAHDNGMFLVFSNGVGRDGNEIRTGNAMILDPYGRILGETWKADDAMVTAELDSSLLPLSTGRRWIQVRRPELYQPLIQRIGNEKETAKVRFGEP